MGRTTNKGDLPQITRNKIDKVWEIPTEDWYNLATAGHPSNNWSTSGRDIKGRCVHPKHKDDDTPSFSINLDKKIAKCFGCNFTTNDSILLYSMLTRIPYEDAVSDITMKYGYHLINKKDLNAFRDQERIKHAHNLLLGLAASDLMQAFADPDAKEVDYARPLVTYLKDVRHLEILPAPSCIGVVPPESRIVATILDTTMQVEVSNLLKPIQGIKWIGQLMSAYHFDLDRIAYFKVRRVHDGLGNLTESGNYKKEIVSLYHPDMKTYSDEAALFGLPYFVDRLGETTAFRVTEGEFDVLSFHSKAIINGLDSSSEPPIVAIGGGSSGYNLNSIHKTFGVKFMDIITDAPSAHGDDIAYNIIKKNNGEAHPYVYKWDNKELGGTDLDELCHLNDDFKEVYDSIASPSNYCDEEEFTVKRINSVIKTASAGRVMPDVNKVRYISGEVETIYDPILVSTVIPKVCKLHDIDPELVVCRVRPREETEEIFLKRLKTLFEKTFNPIGEIINYRQNESELIVWDREYGREGHVSPARMKETQSIFARKTGSLVSWIKGTIGIPSCYAYSKGKEPGMRNLADIEKDLGKALEMVIKNSMKGQPSVTVSEAKGDGLHVNRTKGLYDNPFYLINGPHAFRGEFHKDTGLKWEKKETPVIDGHYILLSGKKESDKWAENATTAEAMNGDRLSLKEIRDKLTKIIRHCCRFVHDVDYDTAIAFLMYLPIFGFFPKNAMLNISGETHTGKSTYGLGFVSGLEGHFLKLVECAIGMKKCSEPGLRQGTKYKCMTVCLDEFEDKGQGDSKSKTISNILDTLKTVQSGAQVIKGTTHGEAIKYRLEFPIITMAIRPLVEPADRNRFLSITTRREHGMKNAAVLMAECVTPEEQEALRDSLTMSLFQHVPKILECYKRIEAWANSGTSTYKGVLARTLDATYPMAAVMAASEDSIQVGIDFIKRCIDERGSFTEDIATTGVTTTLWNDLLRAPSIPATNSDGEMTRNVYTIADVIRRPDLRSEFDKEKKLGIKVYQTDEPMLRHRKFYLICYWDEAKHLFSPKSEFRGGEISAIKEIADRDSRVLSDSKVMKIPKWRYLLNENPNLREVSIIDVTDIVRSGNVGAGDVTPPTPAEISPFLAKSKVAAVDANPYDILDEIN